MTFFVYCYLFSSFSALCFSAYTVKAAVDNREEIQIQLCILYLMTINFAVATLACVAELFGTV